MSSRPKSLRAIGALCLALLLYAAVPHSHGDAAHDSRARGAHAQPASDANAAAAPAPLAPSAPGIAPDDAHDSHSSTSLAESHPCALCREGHGRALAPPADASAPIPADAPIRFAPRDAAPHAERLLARRHPARAPPQA